MGTARTLHVLSAVRACCCCMNAHDLTPPPHTHTHSTHPTHSSSSIHVQAPSPWCSSRRSSSLPSSAASSWAESYRRCAACVRRSMACALHGVFSACTRCVRPACMCCHMVPPRSPSGARSSAWCWACCSSRSRRCPPPRPAIDRQTRGQMEKMDAWMGGWIDGWMARQASLSFSIHLRPGLRRPQRGAQRGHGRQPAFVRGGRRGGGARLASVGLRDRLL